MILACKKRLVFLVIVIFMQLQFHAVNKDSLINVIKSTTSQDSSKFYAYYDLSWEYIYSDVDSAYLLAKKAFSLLKKCKLIKMQPKISNLLGACFQVKGDYVQAIEYYQQSLNYGEKTKNNETILTAYSNIGALYIQLKQYTMAEEYLLKALPTAEKNNTGTSLPSIYNNLSLIYNSSNNYKKALEYGTKSLTLYKKLNDKNGICSASGSIGNAHLSLNEYDRALENYMTCYNVANEIENYFEKGRAALDIGDIYTKKNNLKDALTYLLISKKIGIENEHDETTSDALLHLYNVYKKQGDKVKALENYEAYVALKEKLDDNFRSAEVGKREVEFEFNKRTVRDSIKNAEQAKLKDLQLKANKAQIDKDKFFKIALSIGFALVLIFGLIIFNRFRIITKQKQIIEIKEQQTQEQKNIIENKNKEILDSINYAQRIQL